MAMKYPLPEIPELKKLGFKFKFNTIKEFFTYAEDFVKDHNDEVFNYLIPGFNLKLYELTIEQDTCDDTYLFRLNDRILRLAQGKIEKEDYLFVVHPVHKNDHSVLVKVWTNRRMRYAIDSRLVLYYPKAFGVEPIEAINLTLLNELFVRVIRKLPKDAFPPLREIDQGYQQKINYLENKLKIPDRYGVISPSKKLHNMMINHSIDKVKDAMYHDIFSRSLSTAERASYIYNRVGVDIYITKQAQPTSIEDKQMVIRYYLKTFTSKVQKKKNSNGKGINRDREKKIKKYIKKNPDANNSEVARALGASRNTVRKYR
jgi:hypothetical protein